MTKLFILIALLLIPSFSFAQDVDLMWKARAIKASENLSDLESDMKKKNAIETRLKVMLETAYGLIVTEPKITVKKTSILIPGGHPKSPMYGHLKIPHPAVAFKL